MSSSAKMTTRLKQGGQAKVTLEATAPGMAGRHSKEIVQLSGPSSSKVEVSAIGASRKKSARITPRGSGTTPTLLLQGAIP